MKSAIRSKLFVSLMGILLLTVIGLPMSVKGDGTLAGQVKVILYYTLGLASVILGVATVWASSGAISQEVEFRQIQLVVVKPVRHIQIWLGKWLGLVVMNALLLGFSGLIIFGLVNLAVRSSDHDEQERKSVEKELLTGRRVIRPRDTLAQEMLARYHNLMQSGIVPQDFDREEILNEIRKEILAEKTMVAPSSVKRWVLDIPDIRSLAGGGEREITLMVNFSPVRSGYNPVSGEWRIVAKQHGMLMNMSTNSTLDGMYRLAIPISRSLMAEVMSGDSGTDGYPAREMVVEFRNGDSEKSRTVTFDRKHGIELFIMESGFTSNLARALMIILCRLALLAALGLTAGTLFSFPVAAFSAFSVIVVSIVAHYFAFTLTNEIGTTCCEEHAAHEAKHSLWQEASEKAAIKMDAALDPVMSLEAVRPLSDGELVPWSSVGKSVFLMAVLYSGLLGAGGVLFFRRRELALPYT